MNQGHMANTQQRKHVVHIHFALVMQRGTLSEWAAGQIKRLVWNQVASECTLALPWKLKVRTYSPGRVSLWRITKSPWLRAPPTNTS